MTDHQNINILDSLYKLESLILVCMDALGEEGGHGRVGGVLYDFALPVIGKITKYLERDDSETNG